MVPGAKAEDKKSEQAKIQTATGHFTKAKDAFAAAGKTCAAFRSKFQEQEKVALLDRDIHGFERTAQLLDKVTQEIKSHEIPSLESVHAVMSDISDTLVFSKMRAEAHRGMPGHFPKNY
jgi:hypothetical protein